MHTIALINGPNLNLLGVREPDIYGHATLADINQRLTNRAKIEGVTLLAMQSNAEHELIEYVQNCRKQDVAFIMINAAAYTHTSLALADALSAVAIPYIEVHISNTHRREHYRHFSYLSAKAYGIISGFGHYGYDLALQAALHYVLQQEYVLQPKNESEMDRVQ